MLCFARLPLLPSVFSRIVAFEVIHVPFLSDLNKHLRLAEFTVSFLLLVLFFVRPFFAVKVHEGCFLV